MYLKTAKIQEHFVEYFCKLPNEIQHHISKFIGEENAKMWLENNFPKIQAADFVIQRPNRTQPSYSINYKLLSNYLDVEEPIQKKKIKFSD